MRTRIVVNGTYQWSENEPCAVVHRAPGYQVRPANVLGDAIPILSGRATVPTNADVERERKRRQLERDRAWYERNKAHILELQRIRRGIHQTTIAYASEEERIAARRATWRASKARARAGEGGNI